MLQDGMPADVGGVKGPTALYRATLFNRTDIVKRLLHEGPDVNRQDRYKDTPLHYAARNNYNEVARLLVDNGADINISNDDNQTPLDEMPKGSEVESLLLQLQKTAL